MSSDLTQHSDSPLAPLAIAGYEVTEKLGENAHCEVWKAESQLSGSNARAIKFSKSGTREQIGMFAREFKISGAIAHPNVLQVFDFGVTAKRPFIVSEHMPTSLAKHLEQVGKLSEEDVVSLTLQAAYALSAVHGSGIVHGDLKPSNLLIDPQTLLLKVGDFGAAVFAATDPESSDEVQFSGTPFYTSPEQASGQRPDFTSDIYSLGLVMTAMLTGESPLQNLSADQALAAHKSGIDFDVAEIPERLRSIVKKCLEHEIQFRYSNIAELTEDLRKLGGRNSDSAMWSSDQTLTLRNNQGDKSSPVTLQMSIAALEEAGDWVSTRKSSDQDKTVYVTEASGLQFVNGDSSHIEIECTSPDTGKTDILTVSVGDQSRSEIVSVKEKQIGKTANGTRRNRFAIAAVIAAGVIAAIAIAAANSASSGTAEQSSSLISVRESIDLKIRADQPWHDTGIDIESHESVSVGATGEAFYAGAHSTSPDGVTNLEGVSQRGIDITERDLWLARNLPARSLIGKIGDSEPFYVGANINLTFDRSGRLFLAMNELTDTYHDNSGEWDVNVQVGQAAQNFQTPEIPQLYFHTLPEDGSLSVSAPTVDENGEDFALFRVQSDPSLPADIVGLNVDVLEPLPSGQTSCFFIRTIRDGAYGPASPTACATQNTFTELKLEDTASIGSSRRASAIAMNEETGLLFIGQESRVLALNIDTLETEHTTRLDIPADAFIVDLEINPVTGNLIYLAQSRGGSFLGFLDDSLEQGFRNDDLDQDFHELETSRGRPGEVFVFSGRGWIVISAGDGRVLRTNVMEDQKTSEGQLSPDGKLIIAQKGDSTHDDTVYILDAETSEELGAFTYGDKGGGVHYVDDGDTDQAILFVGDGSISQNAYVLSVPELTLVQDLNIKGLAWAAEIGEGRLVVGQNRSIGDSRQSSGITLVTLTRDSAGNWNLRRDLELESGGGSYALRIVCTEDGQQCYTPSAKTGLLYVFSPN